MSQSSPSQEDLQKFVDREIYACQSSLVEEMLLCSDKLSRSECSLPEFEDIRNYYIYTCPECGDSETTSSFELVTDKSRKKGEIEYCCPSCKKELEEEPELEHQEIFEWWLCSDWLLDKLEERGQPVLRSDLGSWWGRTCTGQSIILDSVIEDIFTSLHNS